MITISSDDLETITYRIINLGSTSRPNETNWDGGYNEEIAVLDDGKDMNWYEYGALNHIDRKDNLKEEVFHLQHVARVVAHYHKAQHPNKVPLIENTDRWRLAEKEARSNYQKILEGTDDYLMLFTEGPFSYREYTLFVQAFFDALLSAQKTPVPP